MDDILGLGRAKPGGHAGRIKDLFRQRFGLGDEVTLMVSELRCHEDNCPEVETVVAVMTSNKAPESWKIAKPMAAVTSGDVAVLPENALDA